MMLLLRYCTQCISKFGKCSSVYRTGKCLFSSQSQKRAVLNNVQTNRQLYLFYMQERLCLKSFKLGLSTLESRTSRYKSWILRRQRNQRSNCLYLLDHRGSKRIPEKTYTSALLTMLKPLTCKSQNTIENS